MANTTFDKNTQESPIVVASQHRIPMSIETSPGSDVYVDVYNLPEDLLQAFGIRLPEKTFNTKSEQYLIDVTDSPSLTIPDGTSIAIYKDKEFDQTVHFRIGDGSKLFMLGDSLLLTHMFNNEFLTMFDLADVSKPAGDFTIKGHHIKSTTPQTSDFMKLEHDAFTAIRLLSSRIENFESFGVSKGGLTFEIVDTGLVNFKISGLLENPSLFHSKVTWLNNSGLNDPPTDAKRVQFNLVTLANQALQAANCQASLQNSEAIYYINPHATDNSRFALEDIRLANPNTFVLKKGLVVEYDTVISGTSSRARFHSVAHGMTNKDDYVAIIGSTVYPGAVGEFIFVDVDNFEIEGTAFSADDAAVATTSSLGYDFIVGSSTENTFIGDPKITTKNVDGLPDTMNQAEMDATRTIIVVINTVNIWVNVVDTVPAVGDFILDPSSENFEIKDADDPAEKGKKAIIKHIAKKTLTYKVSFEVKARNQDTGTAQFCEIALAEGIGIIPIDKTVRSLEFPGNSSIPETLIYPGGLITLDPDEELGLIFRNESSSNNMNLSRIAVLFTEA